MPRNRAQQYVEESPGPIYCVYQERGRTLTGIVVTDGQGKDTPANGSGTVTVSSIHRIKGIAKHNQMTVVEFVW
jgi:hypothetical protein